MKRFLTIVCSALLVTGAFAAETIYKGAGKKEVVSYYQSGKFYSDAARKNMLFNHPGNVVGKEAKIPYGKGLYRFSGGRIHKGFSIKKEDCLATLVELKTKRGDIVEAKIYQGYAIARDIVTKNEKGSVKTVTSYKITTDGIKAAPVKVLYTIKDGKMFRGDSTDVKNCVLNWTGSFNGARLLFMAIEFAK